MKRLLIRTIIYLKNIYYLMQAKVALHTTKTDKKTILFDSYAGSFFNDNPYALMKELENSNYKLVYALKKKQIESFKQLHPKVDVVIHHSYAHFKMLKKAKLWVFNYKTPPYFLKGKETIFLQTWHGIPLKKLGADLSPSKKYYYRSLQTYQQMVQTYIDEGNKCDLFITPSDYALKTLSSAFKLDHSKCLKTMYPRNKSLIINNNHDYIDMIKNKLNIPLDKKIILYAPTWRDDSASLVKGYNINSFIDFEKFNNQLNDDYIILYRPHYLIKNHEKTLPTNVIDTSKYKDITDLYLISDILITDYSSVYFDYSILHKPMYFYTPDLDNYQDILRGFYIDIDKELPNDYYLKQDKLAKAINDNYVNLDKESNYYLNNQTFSYKININKIMEEY